jgi:hypothetical protein
VSRSETPWDTIDCHLHLLDFLQKSSGTGAALQAMDDCSCERAVLFGMPCCKKWVGSEPVQPLYYQDDNGPCYVYSYADQMVADAWLALPDESRKRFAPMLAAFNPTDLAAIDHVRRMYEKYPQMWRGIGEVMCRHDDLTTMLLDKEVPRCNHPALDAIYEFAIEKDLPILVHHNADRLGSSDDKFAFVCEVEEVLIKYPKLKFVWVHSGVSRRLTKEKHHEMIDRLLSTYPNIFLDISWVIWEEVICTPAGDIKDEWVKVCEKHPTRFTIGSDQVAQFYSVPDAQSNLLSANIKKYWPLFEKLSEAAGKQIAYGNAFDWYFKDWDVPKAVYIPGATAEEVCPPVGRYTRAPGYYKVECLEPMEGKFLTGEMVFEEEKFNFY